ncbi:MAG: IclR family transcriptional regulator [Dermatophilaceae bacterium]
MKNPPPYGIASVDHALQLAVMLQVEGPLTVSAAADRLGVARSTAHRLLSMLVYRDFAVQRSDRRYDAGPVLSVAATSRSRTALLREVALPHLEMLALRTQESANLLIRTGALSRFIACVEGTQVLRVGDREGMVFPAHLTSGGRLLLADLDDEALDAVYESQRAADPQGPTLDVGALRADLRRLRRRGFALNVEGTESGVTAVGYPVRGADGRAIAAVSVGMPSSRFQESRLAGIVAALAACADGIERELDRHTQTALAAPVDVKTHRIP